MSAGKGRVTRVNGPLVEVEGIGDVAVMDLVEMGPRRLVGEVVSVRPDTVTAQVFEYTGGLCVGDGARGLGQPLSTLLGPHLLGSAYDGLLRPLSELPTWLAPGIRDHVARDHRHFIPSCQAGDVAGPGTVLGVVATDGAVEHRVMVPPGAAGTVESVAAESEVASPEPVARVGGRPVYMTEEWPVRRVRPVRSRLELGPPLLTGQRVIDLLFPVAKGGTAAVPGGFGTGKTMLLQQIAKWSQADVIVFVACGERGNELADVLTDLGEITDPRTGGPLAARTVVIANTSNMPVMAREASIYTGMTVAEYFRDMGYDVVLVADSTSRWAEALREFSSRNAEVPAEEGYPAALASALAAFYERAGRVRTLNGAEGSVTVIGAVSPPGGDMSEPVAAHTERFVRCLWSLDRDLAYARHYPAVSWHRSFSRDLDDIGAWHAGQGRPGWRRDQARAVELLADCDRLASLVELVGLSALPAEQRIALLAGRIMREAVLQQNALNVNDASCSPSKQAALLDVVLDLYDRCMSLLGQGVPAETIEQFDFSALTRLRTDLGPDDADGVTARWSSERDRLDGLAGGSAEGLVAPS